MENEFTEQRIDYSFLENEAVEKHFADLNIKLLSGKHIHFEDYNSFSLLEDWYGALNNFYNKLYRIELVRDVYNQSTYYYLDFFTTGQGKLSDPSRNRALTELQTIIGLMLLDMFYVKYFDEPKMIYWKDIKLEIENGENKINYQRVFFDTPRPDYTEAEWLNLERKFKLTINSFHELGWVNKVSGQHEDLSFEIKPAIHRLAKLYEKELMNFDEFALQITAKKEEEE